MTIREANSMKAKRVQRACSTLQKILSNKPTSSATEEYIHWYQNIFHNTPFATISMLQSQGDYVSAINYLRVHADQVRKSFAIINVRRPNYRFKIEAQVSHTLACLFACSLLVIGPFSN